MLCFCFTVVKFCSFFSNSLQFVLCSFFVLFSNLTYFLFSLPPLFYFPALLSVSIVFIYPDFLPSFSLSLPFSLYLSLCLSLSLSLSLSPRLGGAWTRVDHMTFVPITFQNTFLLRPCACHAPQSEPGLLRGDLHPERSHHVLTDRAPALIVHTHTEVASLRPGCLSLSLSGRLLSPCRPGWDRRVWYGEGSWGNITDLLNIKASSVCCRIRRGAASISTRLLNSAVGFTVTNASVVTRV